MTRSPLPADEIEFLNSILNEFPIVRKEYKHNWKAPKDAILPHFIIGGAMKSGTSSMHAMLAQHPKVFIPEEEIGFFDIDNLIEHYDFNFFDRRTKQWTTQDMNQDPRQLWEWYSSKFEKGKGMLLGEDSTSYLTSKIAAERISTQDEEIKLIFNYLKRFIQLQSQPRKQIGYRRKTK